MSDSRAFGTREYSKRITAGVTVPEGLLAVLQECIISDLNRMQQAMTAVGARNDVHLFAFFQGLGRWQSRLLAKTDAMPDNARVALIDNYLCFFLTAFLAGFSASAGRTGFLFYAPSGATCRGVPRTGMMLPAR